MMISQRHFQRRRLIAFIGGGLSNIAASETILMRHALAAGFIESALSERKNLIAGYRKALLTFQKKASYQLLMWNIIGVMAKPTRLTQSRNY